MQDLVERPQVVIATTNALKVAIEDNMPKTVDGVAPTVFDRQDDVRIKDLDTYPAVVILGPDFDPFPLVQRQEWFYTDIDRINGTIKQFHPPKTTKVNYSVVTVCENPDNDLILGTRFNEIEDLIPELAVRSAVDTEEYISVPLYWNPVGRLGGESGLITRVWRVYAQLAIRQLKYKTRYLLDPLNPIQYILIDMFGAGSPFAPLGYIPNTIDVGTTTIVLVDGTSNFPASGVIKFLRNEELFEYTSKIYNSLIGVVGTQEVHMWGETIQLVQST